MNRANNINLTAPDVGRTRKQKKYDIILADPPWDLNQKGKRGAVVHYDLMTIDRIKGMDEAIRSIAAEDCWLWLWVTNAIDHKLASEVLEAWGFTYRGKITWDKRINNGLGSPLRNCTEHLILASRGKPEFSFKNQGTFLGAPRQDHSHKPEEQYAIIERLVAGCGMDNRIELFGRRRQHGWDIWGNEVDSDITLAEFGYPVPSDTKFNTNKENIL